MACSKYFPKGRVGYSQAHLNKVALSLNERMQGLSYRLVTDRGGSILLLHPR